jgi:hypothetical protein
MRDQIPISKSMLDDFESTWRRRRRLAQEAVVAIGWMTVVLSALFLATAVVGLSAGNEVFGLTVLACVPMPPFAFGIVLIVVRRDVRKADNVLLMIDDIRRRGPAEGGRP